MNRNGRVSFNDNWRFLKGDASGAQEIGFDDSSWRELRLPHDWAIEGPFDEKYNARCGGLPFHGTGWYRKRFYLPEDTEGNVVAIEFDGAMCNSEVWVNGEFLGSRPFGYMGFQYDLSRHLKYGAENVIAVKLSPEDLSSRWYPGAGLYRNVWLEIKSGIHIGHWGTSVTTPEVSDAQSVVNVQIDIVNASGQSVDATVETALIDDSGNEVASAKTLLEVSENENSARQSLEIPNPRRWDVDDPFLYRAVT